MLEELYRMDNIQNFLKHFSSYNWKKIAFLMIEYGIMLFEHNFNMNNMTFNDLCKIIEDLKYEKYNYLRNSDKILLNNSSRLHHEDNSKKNNFSNKNVFSGTPDLQHINNALNIGDSYNNNSENTFNIKGSINNNNRFNSPNKSVYSKQSYVSARSTASLKSQRLENALERSPSVRPGKFVYLDEDPEKNEVIIKVNKDTYNTQLKNNKDFLTFQKVNKENKKNIKPIKNQQSTSKPKNKKSSKKIPIIQKVVSVDEILDKLKLSPKKEIVIRGMNKNNETSITDVTSDNKIVYHTNREKKFNKLINEKNNKNSYKTSRNYNEFHDYDDTINDTHNKKTIYVIKKPNKKYTNKKIIIRSNETESSDLSEYDEDKSTITEEIVFKGKRTPNYETKPRHYAPKYKHQRVFSNSHVHKKGKFIILFLFV